MLCESTDKPKDPSVECEMHLYCTELLSSFPRWSSKPVVDCVLEIENMVVVVVVVCDVWMCGFGGV